MPFPIVFKIWKNSLDIFPNYYKTPFLLKIILYCTSKIPRLRRKSETSSSLWKYCGMWPLMEFTAPLGGFLSFHIPAVHTCTKIDWFRFKNCPSLPVRVFTIAVYQSEELTTVQFVWHSCLTDALKWSRSDLPSNPSTRAVKKKPAYAWEEPERYIVSYYPFLCPCSIFRCPRYHKFSSDGWLADPIKGALGRGTSFEIKDGFHDAAALVWVGGSHHEEFLIWVVLVWLLCTLCVINGGGLPGDVVTFRVARVEDVGWVRGFLECSEKGDNAGKRWLEAEGEIKLPKR